MFVSYFILSLFFSVSISSFFLYCSHHDSLICKAYFAFIFAEITFFFYIGLASSSGVRLHYIVDNQIFSHSGACIIFLFSYLSSFIKLLCVFTLKEFHCGLRRGWLILTIV